MKFFLNILAQMFFGIALVIFAGGIINSIFGMAMKFNMRHGPIELPTDYLTTFVATLVILLIAGFFWFLGNTKYALQKMKENVKKTSIIMGIVAIAIIFVIVYLPKLPFDKEVAGSIQSYTSSGDLPNLQTMLKDKKNDPQKLNETLEIAIAKENIEIMQLLFDSGANVNYRSKILQTTPLMEAVRSKKFSVIETLIKNKADVNLLDSSGMNVAMLTINFRKLLLGERTNEEEILKIIQLFVDNGLKLDTIDSTFKKNILEMAEYRKYTKLVEYLHTKIQ